MNLRTIAALATFALVATVGGGASLVGSAAPAFGSATASPAVTLVPGARSITGGGDHFCVLTSAGGVECWGFNAAAELGDGTRTDSLTPVFVSGLTTGVADVAGGGWNTCAVTISGGAQCWGENQYGVDGDGTTVDRLTPVGVSGLSSGVAAISVGYYHACALTVLGGVKCWGENTHGELGDGTTIDRLTPVDVSGLTSGVTSIATGLDHSHHDHTCAVTAAGGVKCWGDNQYGELGDGTTIDRLTPVDVSGLTSGVARVYAGGTATCAVMISGVAKCWGNNDAGQLGDGTTTDRSTPVDVVGLGSVATMAMSQSSAGEGIGGSHTCAVTTEGAVECWGNGADGQLGDGTTSSSSTPVGTTGLTSGTVGVATNFWDGCAISSAGAVKCWGSSEVGDGTTLVRLTPVDVSGSFYRTECPTLIASSHTSFTMSDGYAVGSTATFVADAGYLLVGSSALTCQAGPVWSSPPPSAVAVSATPTVLPGTGSVVEGDSGTTILQVPVTLATASLQTVTVQWRTLYVDGAEGDQATPGTDYEAASGTVTFAPGQTAQTVPITVYGDTLVEPDEYIVVSFDHPTNARMGGVWGLGFGTILDDDHATVLPGAGTVTAPASGTADLAVPVTLSNPSTLPITVQWTTLVVADAPVTPDGPQAPISDYTPSSGTVTFAPGDTTAEVHIPVTADTYTPGEYVVVSFTHPTNATMGGVWGLGFGLITPAT